jgi:hypothetical protein
MVRQLYIILLALHPARFRYRFAFEMLAIFDEASAHDSGLPLLADGLRSLIRQRVHPYRPEAVAAVPAGAGVPIFHSLDTSLPARRYFMTGAALSLALFSALTISIGRGGRSPGILLIGSFLSRPGLLGVDWSSIEPSQPTTEVKVRAAPPARPKDQLVTSLYPLFGLGVLFFFCDSDGNLMLSAAEMANAPAMLRTLDRNKDGSLGPNEATFLQLAVLDEDRDGIISSAEIDHSTAVLRSLDSNHDGTVVLAEVLAAVRAAKAH